jgi:asparagine synthase (glutamine-hydrolysing)
MCGIAGVFSPNGLSDVDKDAIYPMTSILAHRGPDGQGIYTSDTTLLGQRRLSIIDLSGGKQPMSNEDGTIWVIFNGEIFNYVELMDSLKKKGHRFATRSDTEVIVHLYEEYGTDLFNYCNGQFAIALWDTKKKKILLARDRVGIRPLFYAKLPNKKIVFASEMKSLFCHPECIPQIDPVGLDQTFSLWANVPPTTMFKGVEELAPGCCMVINSDGDASTRRFWSLTFPKRNEFEFKPIGYYQEKLREILYDAVTLRLRADVPVAAYLSGGIDSSIISALVKKHHINNLITFSVAFKDEHYDEREYQQEMVRFLNTDHRTIEANYENIGGAFSDVVWYTERPMIRTAPAPLFLLSKLVRDNGIKVVLTGEGADEMLGGYDIFKENAIRRFWARQPDSQIRPLLFSKIYPDVKRTAAADQYWKHFFKNNIGDTENPFYSHVIRWNNTAQVKSLFSSSITSSFDAEKNIYSPLRTYLDPDFAALHPLCSAQYLEIMIFLSGYLLSSQGDRMMMGNSVEGRFPFLDYRLIEFAATIPPEYKLMGLNEKHILKQAYTDVVPPRIRNRTKKPYRAPINQCFMEDNFAASLLTEEKIKSYGYFNTDVVSRLTKKMKERNGQLSERENMAVVAVTSTQLLHHHFIERDWNATAKSFNNRQNDTAMAVSNEKV